MTEEVKNYDDNVTSNKEYQIKDRNYFLKKPNRNSGKV